MDFIPLPSLSSIILTVFLISILYAINAFVIKPHALYKFYIRQGLISEEEANSIYEEYKKKGDIPPKLKEDDNLARYRAVLRKYPKTIGIVKKLGSTISVEFTSTDCLRAYADSPDYVNRTNSLIGILARDAISRLQGERHKHIKETMSSAFHFCFSSSNDEMAMKVAQEKFEEWESKGWIGKEYIDIFSETQSYTGELIHRTFFGDSVGQIELCGKKITDLVFAMILQVGLLVRQNYSQPWIGYLYKLGLLKSHKKLQKEISAYRQFSESIVQKRKKVLEGEIKEGREIDSKDYLSQLLIQQLKNRDDKYKLSDKQIADQYITFMGAGTPNTSRLAVYCLYQLTQNPEYKARICNEISTHIKDIQRLSREDINKIELLNPFVKEALRMYSSLIAIPKVASKDNFLGNIKVKKGTLVYAFLLGAAFREDLFKEPEKFDPERWIGDGEGNKLTDPFVFLPYWAGTRKCIGENFVTFEMKRFLIQILSRYNFELLENYELELQFRLVTLPKKPIKMRFTKLLK